MTGVLRWCTAAIDTAAAVLERRAAEIRFGTDLMRTVRLDDVVSQLRVGTGSQEAAEAAAELALELMKNGVRAKDVEPLLRARHHSELMEKLDISTVDVLAAYGRRTERRPRGGDSLTALYVDEARRTAGGQR